MVAALAVAGWALGWLPSSKSGAPTPGAATTVTVTAAVPPAASAVTDTTTPSLENPTASSDTATTVVSSPSQPSTIPSATTLTPSEQRAQAFSALEQMVTADAQTNPIRGQWVAQLASKYEGVIDRTQQAAPFSLVQILAEINRIKANPEYGSLVRVIHQGDWAGSTPGPTPLWVTFADLNASSKDQVVVWCRSHFSQRGQALLNVCYPRQLNPK